MQENVEIRDTQNSAQTLEDFDSSVVKILGQVDYIALNTNYGSRLLLDSKSDEPNFRFKLPPNCKDEKYSEWVDWLSDREPEEYDCEMDEEYEGETNTDKDYYRVVLLSDSYCKKGLYLFTEDAKELIQFSNFHGVIVFRRTDKKAMNISQYMKFADSINIGYCSFNPCWHDNMCILILPNGKTMLYVNYDCYL
uniref:Uncharacterized protein n=1 Tax=Marseillevirus LCMAC102 TaxID=2506603 RepID=A0A481YTT4_9VIRU|nr:MAG: hypothetical protein LCMAC102_04140 [Marseillevirus LCMAC102]